jgi:hypothetical protein
MTENNDATTMSEQDIVKNQTEKLVTDELPTNPQTSDDSVVFVEDGEWVDPRKEVTGKYVENHGEKINAAGKVQRSITVLLTDGSTILVSAFGAKVGNLANRKLGAIYTFRGILKTKTGMYLGKERTSQFLNL